ncbi:MAG: hypothetical protein CFE44_04865 [Burkholderiales bacterium PBB4]|nr:MAG: hypothetical protein CFE44_04865 [Burkholderiales bacterium PBB4]
MGLHSALEKFCNASDICSEKQPPICRTDSIARLGVINRATLRSSLCQPFMESHEKYVAGWDWTRLQPAAKEFLIALGQSDYGDVVDQRCTFCPCPTYSGRRKTANVFASVMQMWGDTKAQCVGI